MNALLSTFAKRLASSEALARPAAAAADALLRSRGCLFTFHRAAPSRVWDTLPNRDFYLDLDFLDRLLGYLTQRGWNVVTMDEALRRSAKSRRGRFVNFSVDDCYRDTFEQVVPLFRRHGVPVTLFVTTGIPDATLALWAAGLEDTLLARDSVIADDETFIVRDSESKRRAFDTIASRWDGPGAAARYDAFCRANGVDAQALHDKHAISWQMLEDLRDDPLVEIGAHTVSHARISSLPPTAALSELQGSGERLRQRLGVAAKHFAFPYGRRSDAGPRDFALARRAGFASAATTRKGLIGAKADAFSLPRNTINGAHRSLPMMEWHLTGLTGAAAALTGRV